MLDVPINAPNKLSNATYNITIDGLSVKGADYGVFAGYGHTLGGNFYLGAEAEYNLSNAKNTIALSSLGAAGDAKTSKQSSYGAAVRAGYVVENVMPYVRVGYNQAKFEQEITGMGKEDATKGGIAVGAGIEFAPLDNVGIRGEFVRTAYNEIEGSGGGVNWSYKPVENVARVGLSYRF